MKTTISLPSCSQHTASAAYLCLWRTWICISSCRLMFTYTHLYCRDRFTCMYNMSRLVCYVGIFSIKCKCMCVKNRNNDVFYSFSTSLYCVSSFKNIVNLQLCHIRSCIWAWFANGAIMSHTWPEFDAFTSLLAPGFFWIYSYQTTNKNLNRKSQSNLT